MTSTNILDEMTQPAAVKRKIVLLDANRITDNSTLSSSHSKEQRMTFSAEAISKSVEEAENEFKSSRNNKKRKEFPCQNTNSELMYLPALTAEADVSKPDGRDEDEDDAVVTSDDCNDFESTKEKRRRTNINTEESDLIVVLDMDECLIHFGMQEDKENESQLPACDDGIGNCENINGSNGATTEHPISMYVNKNKVFLRPGLIQFLKFVTARFDTHIFTAGTKDYADSILDQLCLLVGDKNAFSKRWYRDDCETIDILDPLTFFCIDSLYVKPLSKVLEWVGRDSEDLRRIVHVDDQARNFLLNHGNGIRVSEWRGDDPNDNALLQVTKVLLKIDANNFGDVRPHLRHESYSTLKDQLDMMIFFPHRRTKGIGSTFL